ncbi:MAG: hypothetical protein U5K72_16860 [Balneolaceae bacterium]|nr:hypothetical protein [Balneolaceae bacterium]
MIYQFPYLCPNCNEEMEITIRVSADGTSIIERQTISTTPIVDPEFDDSDYLPGNLISGPMTNARTGKIQHWEMEIGTKFIEVWEDILPEMGERYVDEDLTKAVDEPGESSWSVDNLTVHVEDTGQQETIQGFPATIYEVEVRFEKTDFNPDGEETSRDEMNYQFQLWLSEEMPFTPLPFHYAPFKEKRIPPYNLSPINDLVISTMLDKIKDKGGLVKSKLIVEDEEWTVGLKNVRATPPVPMHKFEDLPVVSASQVDNFAGPLFIVSMLRDGELSEMGSGTIQFDDREISARSAWKVNDEGDLVIVVTAEDENTTFFLVRPLKGLPGVATFDVKNRPERSVLRSMSEEELAEHSNSFQMYGLVSGEPFPTVITGFQSGSVTIENAGNDIIKGRTSGEVLALPTDQISEIEATPFEITFTSESGLEKFQFRSPEARVAGR